MPPHRKFIPLPDYGNTTEPTVRARYALLEAKVSIIGNTLLFIIKLIFGLFINSIALIADAIHTLSDVGTSTVVIFGFKYATQPSDQEHPFGHGRIEYIATLIMAIILALIGIGFIQQSIERALEVVPLQHQEFSLIIGIIIIISSIAKELMARFSFSIGRKIKSDTLTADAWHHRSDVFASIGVGISIIASSYGFPLLDPLFGIIVSGIILYVSINLIRTTSNFLIGYAPDPELVATIKDLAHTITEIKGIHAVHVHDYGSYKVVTLHIQVDNALTVEAAHDIADQLEKKIKHTTQYASIIHVEPIRRHQTNK
jgi:cation diffusion facilitator family transporter